MNVAELFVMGTFWTQDITFYGTKKSVTKDDNGKAYYLEITSGENAFKSDAAGIVIIGKFYD